MPLLSFEVKTKNFPKTCNTFLHHAYKKHKKADTSGMT